jgi:hypothetical protein
MFPPRVSGLLLLLRRRRRAAYWPTLPVSSYLHCARSHGRLCATTGERHTERAIQKRMSERDTERAIQKRMSERDRQHMQDRSTLSLLWGHIPTPVFSTGFLFLVVLLPHRPFALQSLSLSFTLPRIMLAPLSLVRPSPCFLRYSSSFLSWLHRTFISQPTTAGRSGPQPTQRSSTCAAKPHFLASRWLFWAAAAAICCSLAFSRVKDAGELHVLCPARQPYPGQTTGGGDARAPWVLRR